MAETREILFITYAYDDPHDAPVLDVSGSIEEARRNVRGRGGFCWRARRQEDGTYIDEAFIEVIWAKVRANRR